MRRRRGAGSTLVGGLATLAIACSSGSEEIPEEVSDKLLRAIDEVESSDGLHLRMDVAVYTEGGAGSPSEPDETSCLEARFEPAGTSEAGERLYMNFGTPTDDGTLCALGSAFTVDGTRVYVETDEHPPGGDLGFLWRVGETTPELIAQMSQETGGGTELANLVQTALGYEGIDSHTVAFELDPEEVADRAPPEAATAEPADSVTLTARYHPDDTGRLQTLEYEISAGDGSAMLTYSYEAYNEPQNVGLPEPSYITPGVTPLTTIEDLRAFVGLDPS